MTGRPPARKGRAFGARLLAAISAIGLAWSGAVAVLPARLSEPVRRVGRFRGRTGSLSGSWRGEYAYHDTGRSTPFVALLRQKGAVLSGEIEEPNTFGHPGAAALRAVIAGRRAGAFISFRKTYDGAGGQAHSVEYTGEINANETRIDGLWRIGMRTGPFFMERDRARPSSGGEAAASAQP